MKRFAGVMPYRKSAVVLAVLAALGAGLASCGGGGGGSSVSEKAPGAATYTISGQVTSGGSGVAGVTMTLSGASSSTATTDAGGNYTFSGLANGSYTITPGKAGYTFSPVNNVRMVNGLNISNVAFTATASGGPTFSISGTIKSVDGLLLSGVAVVLGGTNSATTTTDANGNYTFRGLTDGGYIITPSYADHQFVPPDKNVTVSGRDVTGIDFTSAVNTEHQH